MAFHLTVSSLKTFAIKFWFFSPSHLLILVVLVIVWLMLQQKMQKALGVLGFGLSPLPRTQFPYCCSMFSELLVSFSIKAQACSLVSQKRIYGIRIHFRFIACFEAKDDHKKKNPPNPIHEWKQQKLLLEIQFTTITHDSHRKWGKKKKTLASFKIYFLRRFANLDNF